jgi:hypothetical protein
MSLQDRINEHMKEAMRSKDQPRLETIRLLRAAIQRREVDERVTLDDTQVMGVIEKMIKQGRDAIEQFKQGGRQDLADKEEAQIAVWKAYLPEPLSDAEIDRLIDAAIAETGAASPKDMGKVVGAVKAKVAGRADMGKVSGRIKDKLANPRLSPVFLSCGNH